jgi:hypothetical protein
MSGKTLGIIAFVAAAGAALIWYARSGGTTAPAVTKPKATPASIALALAPTGLSAITSALGLGGGSTAHQAASTPPAGVAPAPVGDNPYGIVTSLDV